MMMQDTYDVGIYCRLSRDDNNGSLESMSIANQRQMLSDYVREKGWKICDIYIDDGYSGTNFNRPDFIRMMADIESGRINCVVTKDLSRLGRNYAKVGYYTDEFFVENGIRFIAVNDSYDSLREEENEIAPFKNVLNEWYPRDISKKVRQVKKSSAQQGKFMGSQAPYGYRKSPLDKHVLEIDPYAANIMRRIFSEFAAGDSARKIADRLNAEGVDSPRFYFSQFPGGQHPRATDKNHWGSASIMQMLRNQVYIGNMVQGKRRVASFKTKKFVAISPDRWIVVEGTHEPLIDIDTWDRVQHRLDNKMHRGRQMSKDKDVALFSGILKCADCGSNLSHSAKVTNNNTIGYYRCSRYLNNGKTACSTHCIKESALKAFVLNDIRYHARLAAAEHELIAHELSDAMNRNGVAERHQLEATMHELQNRLDTIDKNIKSLYEDKCSGKLPEAIFNSLMSGYIDEQAELSEKKSALNETLSKYKDADRDIKKWLDLVEQYKDITELTRAIVYLLIDHIEVGEAANGFDGIQEVTIHYRFIGNLLNPTQKAG